MQDSTVTVIALQDRNLEWFPRLRAMSLAADEGEAEQIELRTLQVQLEKTQALVANLSQQLTELRDQVCFLIYDICEIYLSFCPQLKLKKYVVGVNPGYFTFLFNYFMLSLVYFLNFCCFLCIYLYYISVF